MSMTQKEVQTYLGDIDRCTRAIVNFLKAQKIDDDVAQEAMIKLVARITVAQLLADDEIDDKEFELWESVARVNTSLLREVWDAFRKRNMN